MTDHRSARLNEQLKREISEILSQRVRDPRVGRVLVTEVRVTPDLWVARVFVRALGEERTPEACLAGLETAAPFVRRELGRILHIYRIPEIRFVMDTSLDSAMRIEEILREVLPPGHGEPGATEAAEVDAGEDRGPDGSGPGVGTGGREEG